MDWKQQGVRYAVVGLASNAVLYLAYLVLTGFGVGPKSAMTLLYVCGMLQTYLLNKVWTFQQIGFGVPAFVRYFLLYIGSYFLNLGVLYLLVDRLGFPHAVVQGFAIFGIAALLFVLQRSWVFPAARRRESTLAEPS